MGHIVTLDQNMINMIAAGEVIERPASVVKELMENSIDAGATKITASIEDGGRKSIAVTDNGSGMDADDLDIAFEPHATSKIKTSADLLGISTLGFRGEALASIASVSQIRAISRTKDSLAANSIEIDCGKKTAVTPASADYGTTIQVRDLFYKLPARRKFLKTANTEAGHITEQFTRIALANTSLGMTFVNNGKQIYRLSPNQNIRHRIAELFSSHIAQDLIETESKEKGLIIRALLGKPNISRTNNKLQYVFLNGRYIRDKFISHAVREAYRGTIEPNRFAVAFLFIQMPHHDYDVNVHPTKIEVRFYNANLVHSQILACLREKILTADFDTDAKLPTPHAMSPQINDAMAEFFKKHRPAQNQHQFDLQPQGRPKQKYETTRQTLPTSQTAENHITPQLRTGFMQIHDSFIVAQTDEGFVIIDQHALHERIMYENLRRRITDNKLESQKLLIPESFDLTKTQADTIKNNTRLIERLGIELVPFGPATMAIQAFPTVLAKAAPLDFVRDLIDLLQSKNTGYDTESLLDEVLNMAACKAAIKAGQKLTDTEIQQLLADREKTQMPSRCPHGRPTTIKFSLDQLEKQFKRT